MVYIYICIIYDIIIHSIFLIIPFPSLFFVNVVFLMTRTFWYTLYSRLASAGVSGGFFYCAVNWLKMRRDELWRAEGWHTRHRLQTNIPPCDATTKQEESDHSLSKTWEITTDAESSQSRSIKMSIKLLFICKIYFDVGIFKYFIKYVFNKMNIHT